MLPRLPDAWNGSLVFAGASGRRSEFNGDFAWSDYVLQEGFAYASQNKGVLNFYLVAVSRGGYQVRRAVESAPDIFDGGGVDWEGTFVDEHAPTF